MANATTPVIQINEGNVGIGTTSPDQKLHIDGGASHTFIKVKNSGAYNAGIEYVGGTVDVWKTYLDDATNKFHIDEDGTSYLTIINGGNVGIGTDSPDEVLEVKGIIKSENTGYTNTGIIINQTSHSDAWRLMQFGGGAFSLNLNGYTSGESRFQVDTSGNVSIPAGTLAVSGTGNSSIAGNVGIGTASPSTNYKLDVRGRVLVKGGGTLSNALMVTNNLTANVTGYAGIVANSTLTVNGNESEGSDVLRMGPMANGTGAYFIDVSNSGGNAAYPIIMQPYYGNVGIGTTAPDQKLQVNGNAHLDYSLIGRGIRNSNRGEFHFNATGINDVAEMFFGYGDGYTENNIRWGISDRGVATGQIHMYRGPALGGSFASAQTWDDDLNSYFYGNVGIGTTSPEVELHVGVATLGTAPDINADIISSGGITIENNKRLSFDTSYYVHGNIKYNGTGSSVTEAKLEYQGYYGHNFITRSSSKMVINGNTGNVGIGTVSPAEKLDISSGHIRMSDGYKIDWGGTNARIDGSNADNRLRFFTSGVEKVRIDSAGNVGINTTSLTNSSGYSTLSISGTTGGQIAFQTAGTGKHYLYSSALDFNIYNSQAGNIRIYTNASERLRIDSSGNVGIGTTSPDSKLHIDSTGEALRFTRSSQETYRVLHGTSGLYFTRPNSSSLAFGVTQNSDFDIFDTSANVMFRADASTGNVGIETTSPAYKLDVNGDARSTHFRDGAKGTGTTPATAGWYKIASWSTGAKRGGSEIKLSTTGGSFTPITWIIRCYKNWSTDATLKLEQYGYANVYFTKARIVQDTSTSILHLEVYQGVSTALTFHMYQTSLMGFDDFVTMSTGALAAGTTGGTVRTELPFVASGTSLEDLYVNDNIGIGTSTPSQKLDVNGNINISNGGILFQQAYGINLGVSGYDIVMPTATRIAIKTSATERLTILNNGNVGIGTTNPIQKLDVVVSDVNVTPNSESSAVFRRNGNNYLTILTGSTSQGGILFGNAADANDGSISYTQSTQKMAFGTADTTRMVINSSGRVGIGTTGPAAELHVKGGALRLEESSATRHLDIVPAVSGSNHRFTSTTTGSGFNFEYWNGSAATVMASIASTGLTVNSGSIVLSGTGRIQGVDTVTNATDAANKAYVDAQVGSADTLQEVTDNGNTTTNSIGIGTTNPKSILEIASQNPVINFKDTTAGTDLSYRYIQNVDGKFLFAKANDAYNSFTTHMAIDTDGNVGIGTVSPSAKLHVQGTSFFFDQAIFDDKVGIGTTAPTQKLSIVNGDVDIKGGSNSRLFLNIDTNYLYGDVNGVVMLLANDNLRFRTQNLERMRITSAGKIGIGTPSPIDPLNVQSTGSNEYAFRVFRSTSATQGLGGFYEGGANQGQLWLLKGDNSAGVMVNSNGDSYFNGGNVGIGTTSPSKKLHVIGAARFDNIGTQLVLGTNGVAGAYEITTQTSNALTISLSGTAERMRIDSSGNVGIGTTSPAQHQSTNETVLHIANSNVASLNLDSTATNGDCYVLSSTGSGDFRIFNDDTNTTVLNINSSGNSSIGTAAPFATGGAAKLTVAGILSFGVSNSDMSYIRRQNTAGEYAWQTYANGSNSGSIELQPYGGNVSIGITDPSYKLQVNGGILAGGKVTYEKAAGSLDTTGYAVAGLVTGSNGNSSGFTFTCFGNTGDYQRVVYSCYNATGVWNTQKVIDEGTNGLDVTASANGSTITFTFKSRSGSLGYTPRVSVEAVGHSINNTYA